MQLTTNDLVTAGRKVAAPLAVVGSFVLGAALFVGHGDVHAAVAPISGLDDGSVSALTSLDQAMEAVASRVSPAVVNVAVTSRGSSDAGANSQMPEGLPPGFAQFSGPGFGGGGGMRRQQPPEIEHGIGSGVIISRDGYIVTNNHVVDGATQMKVTLHDRRILTAKLVGVDKLTDLAVIKVNATDLPALAWGDSTRLKPGQTVLAFGSPFGFFQDSVTRGIVSAVNRQNPYSDDARKPGAYIQTDAAINPGNSGGALVNAHGELVGINTFIISNSGSFAGAGFAIPSQIVQATVQQLIAHGKVEHGYLGISMNDVTPENAHFFNLEDATGAIVAQVTPDSPASRGGLKQGDVISSLNGAKMVNGSGLQVAVSQMAPGTNLSLGVLRDGNPLTLKLTVGSFDGNHEVAANGEGQDSESGTAGKTGKLGLAVADLTPETRRQIEAPDTLHGVVIESVRPASPADDAGLRPGDVILEVDRKPAASASQFAGEVRRNPASKDLLLLVWREGAASYRTVHAEEGQNG